MSGGPQKSLEERVRALEDQHAIYQLISAYGPAADSCNMADIARIWREDGVYEIGGIGVFEGHAGLKEAFDGAFHQGIVKDGSAHASSLPHVVIDGDRATATHYGTLYAHRDGKFSCIRVIASRWLLVRTEAKGWQIARRTNMLLDGGEGARKLLSEAMKGPDAAE